MPTENEMDIRYCFLQLPNGEEVPLVSNTEALQIQTVEGERRPVVPKTFGFSLEVKMRPAHRSRQRMIDKALKMMGMTEGRRQLMNHLYKVKLQKEPVSVKIMTEPLPDEIDVVLEER